MVSLKHQMRDLDMLHSFMSARNAMLCFPIQSKILNILGHLKKRSLEKFALFVKLNLKIALKKEVLLGHALNVARKITRELATSQII